MDQITLKNTDLRVSRICFGAMTFGGQTGEEAAARMIGLCSEHGINFLDTANVYNRGASEEMLGRLLRGHRQEFVLASKVRMKMGDEPDLQGLSRSRNHARHRRQLAPASDRLSGRLLPAPARLRRPDRGVPGCDE